MISSRLIKSNNTAAGCVDIVDAYDPFDGNGVALYQLNGNATDISGNYNGTWVGTPAYGTGQFGQAATFNSASNTYISASGINNLSQLTASLWVKMNDITAVNRFLGKYDNNGLREFFIYSAGGNFILSNYYNGNNGNAITIPITVANDTWCHLVLVLDGVTRPKAYINGVQTGQSQSDTPTTNAYFTTSVPLTIGNATNPPATTSFNGSIDQVRIFNTALTPLEVEALYTEELCICDGTVDTLDILGDGSCVATYQLNGNANDLSGNYSGTPTNVSYGVGEFDLAGVFNGSSSRIQLNVFNYSAASYSMWGYVDNSTGYNRLISNLSNWETLPNSGAIQIQVNGSLAVSQVDIVVGSTAYSTSQVSIPVNQWVHFCVTYTFGGTLFFYINNNLATSRSIPSSTVNNTIPMYIGYYPRGNSYTICNVDQLRIFNKALNSTEVTTLYNETACTPAACVSGTTNTLDILGDGSCIATYTLDGTPADLSGNYNGVQTDVTYPVGEFDLAGSFNGSSTYIETLSEVVTTNSYSISCWVKQNNKSTDTAYRRIWSQQSNNNKGFYFGKQNNTTNYVYQLGTAFSLDLNDTYKHLVISFDSTGGATGAKTYLNGVLVNTQAYPGFHTNAQGYLNSNFRIGRQFSTFGEYWNGAIDQVRIFNKALSAGEVTTLYNETPCN